MSSLDMRTLLHLSFIDGFLLGVIFLFFSRIKTKYAGTQELGLSLIIISISMILFSMQNMVGPFISIVVANCVCIAGMALIPYGLRKFLGLEVNLKYYAALIFAFFLAVYYYTFILPGFLRIRIIIICLAYFLIFYYSFHILFFLNKIAVLKNISRVASVIYLFVALFALFRLFVFAFYPSPLSFNMMSSPPGLEKNIYLLTLIFGNMYSIGSYTLFILMLNFRLESELVESEGQLKKHVCELEKSDAAKNKFISIISHDLRNPVDGIVSLLSIMDAESDIPPRAASDIKLLKKTSEGLSALLKNLLEWARAQTRNIECRPEKITLAKSIDEILKIFELRIRQKKIVISNEISGDVIVFSDPKMFSTILRNLMSNAIKFTAENGKISLSAFSNKDFSTLIITDTGVGMNGETLDMLFKPGRPNCVSVGTAGESGTGLGLLICKEFAELNGGAINVASERGAGTSVKLSLPAQK
ncbi:MAG TPA: HAMP domain-containing sensor histidine kinase [Candidatus Wallbacteria bacterium]|nr:HAMP domain-containing sensor histidine kinase [Candidatus Wallbacteria bacterium]